MRVLFILMSMLEMFKNNDNNSSRHLIQCSTCVIKINTLAQEKNNPSLSCQDRSTLFFNLFLSNETRLSTLASVAPTPLYLPFFYHSLMHSISLADTEDGPLSVRVWGYRFLIGHVTSATISVHSVSSMKLRKRFKLRAKRN